MAVTRRTFVRAMLAFGSLAGLGVLTPGKAFAARNLDAFQAPTQTEALQALFSEVPEPSTEVTLKVPRIATDGAVVPVTVQTSLAAVETISIFVAENPAPLIAEFMIPAGTEAKVATRVYMRQTSTITAVVKAGGKLYSAEKLTRVTEGGCGGDSV